MHAGRVMGCTQPMGGHIGAGVAVHAARNFAYQAFVTPRCVQPPQHAYVRGGASTGSSSVLVQSASTLHAVSIGGMARATHPVEIGGRSDGQRRHLADAPRHHRAVWQVEYAQGRVRRHRRAARRDLSERAGSLVHVAGGSAPDDVGRRPVEESTAVARVLLSGLRRRTIMRRPGYTRPGWLTPLSPASLCPLC